MGAEFDNLKAGTIEEVITSLTRIIEWSKNNSSRLGYFAALYRKVTIRVKNGIEQGEFTDGDVMEKLDVNFANRYLDAFEKYQSSLEITESWKLTFDTAGKWKPIVLQHLLLGMNTHITLDLAIAASDCSSDGEPENLREDFFKINEILISLVNEVQEELVQVWPLTKILDKLAGETDEKFAGYIMKLTRSAAWENAKNLSGTTDRKRSVLIHKMDKETSAGSKLILLKGFFINLLLFVIRVTELRSVKRIIEILE